MFGEPWFQTVVHFEFLSNFKLFVLVNISPLTISACVCWVGRVSVNVYKSINKCFEILHEFLFNNMKEYGIMYIKSQ